MRRPFACTIGWVSACLAHVRATCCSNARASPILGDGLLPDNGSAHTLGPRTGKSFRRPNGDHTQGGRPLPTDPARIHHDAAGASGRPAQSEKLGSEMTQSGEPVIRVKDLKKYYGEVKAVDGVNFEVARGEVFGMLGPNGAGKTTTIEVLEGLREPDSGVVTVLGMDVTRHAPSIKQRIGVQLQ